MNQRVFLVRHGAVENPKNVRYGRLPGFSLSTRGQAQARASGAFLASLGLDDPLIVTSPLERAHQTASILAESLQLKQTHTDPALLEIASRLDGLPRRWLRAPGLYLDRLRDPALRGHDEPVALAAARIHGALQAALARHHGALVLVSHQVPIRAATRSLSLGLASLDTPLPQGLTLQLAPLNPGYAEVIELHPTTPGRFRPRSAFRPR